MSYPKKQEQPKDKNLSCMALPKSTLRIPINPMVDQQSIIDVKDIYHFDPNIDFPEEELRCSKIGISNQWSNPELSVASYFRMKTRPVFYEAPLKHFECWFASLPFARIFSASLHAGTELAWDYRIVFLNPTQDRDASYTLSDVDSKLSWAQIKLAKFYRKWYPKTINEQEIKQRVEQDYSILIIAFRFPANEVAPASVVGLSKFGIVCGITFGSGKNVDDTGCALVNLSS
jgi:hypothetical protein